MNGSRSILIAVLLVIGGCRAGMKPAEFRSAPGGSPAVIRTHGDWDDVEAAAIVAASKVELALMMIAPSDDRIVIDLTTIRDEPVRVVVRRVPREEGLLELECRVGRFGDAERERMFLAAMARRLGQLYHRDWAPR